jgi:hypothetical protein
LSKGRTKEGKLKRACNYRRYGLFVWSTALQNLKRAGEIYYDPKDKTYALSPEDED